MAMTLPTKKKSKPMTAPKTMMTRFSLDDIIKILIWSADAIVKYFLILSQYFIISSYNNKSVLNHVEKISSKIRIHHLSSMIKKWKS